MHKCISSTGRAINGRLMFHNGTRGATVLSLGINSSL